MTSISIIVPVYNVEKYVEACLQSIMAQTYAGPVECILVDDCGKDDSIDIAERMIAGYEGTIRFRVLHHPHNRGLSAARNTGVEAASGDYLLFVDSDDELTPDCIELLEKPLAEASFDLVVGDTATIGNDDLHEYLRLKLDDGTVLRSADIISHYRTEWNMMAQAKLLKTSFIRQNHLLFKEGIIHEDELWCFQVACTAKSLRIVNHPVYRYMIREQSITADSNKNLWKKIAAKVTIVGEMARFLKSRKLFSPPAYAIIQIFTEEILHYEKVDRQQFRKTYLKLRKEAQFPFLYRIRANMWNFRACMKELHYFMPATLGERYKYWRISR